MVVRAAAAAAEAATEDAAAPDVRAAKAGFGNKGGGGITGGPVGGLIAPIIINARVFSAAAAAAIKLLFSASERRGDRNKYEGSIPGGHDIDP